MAVAGEPDIDKISVKNLFLHHCVLYQVKQLKKQTIKSRQDNKKRNLQFCQKVFPLHFQLSDNSICMTIILSEFFF